MPDLPGRLKHLHAFFKHQFVVGALYLPVHTKVARRRACNGVVVQDRDVRMDAAAFAVVMDDDHRRTVRTHLFRQKESKAPCASQIVCIPDVQFIRTEGQDI